ncbi:hypothetical protein HDU93_006877, partial [Gonapodya sp. JEL0774]
RTGLRAPVDVPSTSHGTANPAYFWAACEKQEEERKVEVARREAARQEAEERDAKSREEVRREAEYRAEKIREAEKLREDKRELARREDEVRVAQLLDVEKRRAEKREAERAAQSQEAALLAESTREPPPTSQPPSSTIEVHEVDAEEEVEEEGGEEGDEADEDEDEDEEGGEEGDEDEDREDEEEGGDVEEHKEESGAEADVNFDGVGGDGVDFEVTGYGEEEASGGDSFGRHEHTTPSAPSVPSHLPPSSPPPSQPSLPSPNRSKGKGKVIDNIHRVEPPSRDVGVRAQPIAHTNEGTGSGKDSSPCLSLSGLKIYDNVDGGLSVTMTRLTSKCIAPGDRWAVDVGSSRHLLAIITSPTLRLIKDSLVYALNMNSVIHSTVPFVLENTSDNLAATLFILSDVETEASAARNRRDDPIAEISGGSVSADTLEEHQASEADAVGTVARSFHDEGEQLPVIAGEDANAFLARVKKYLVQQPIVTSGSSESKTSIPTKELNRIFGSYVSNFPACTENRFTSKTVSWAVDSGKRDKLHVTTTSLIHRKGAPITTDFLVTDTPIVRTALSCGLPWVAFPGNGRKSIVCHVGQRRVNFTMMEGVKANVSSRTTSKYSTPDPTPDSDSDLDSDSSEPCEYE